MRQDRGHYVLQSLTINLPEETKRTDQSASSNKRNLAKVPSIICRGSNGLSFHSVDSTAQNQVHISG